MRDPTRPSSTWLWALGILGAVLIVFLPILDNDFVNWGDHAELTGNPHYRGLSIGRLAWMFTTIHMGHYQPLSWITFAIDYKLWGLNPRGYHLTSLLLHAACAVAVFVLIRRLLQLGGTTANANSPAVNLSALFGALLFALHPLRVESVAWATERRGPLSGLLYVLAVWFYLRYVDARRQAHEKHGGLRLPAGSASAARNAYWSAVLCFLGSLLAKEFGVSLPIVLLVLDAYPLRRLHARAGRMLSRLRRLLLEKLPFLLLAAVWSLIAMASSRQSNVTVPLESLGVASRIVLVFCNLVFTLQKIVWPVDLSPIYELRLPFDPTASRQLLCVAGVVAGTILLVILRRRGPALLAVWVCFVVILLPVLGLVQTGRQFAADRYTYLPMIGLCALAAAACRRVLAKAAPQSKTAPYLLVTILSVVLLYPLGRATRQQCGVWKNSEMLWQHALRIDPEGAVAHANAGLVQYQLGHTAEAIELTRKSLLINPRNAEACNNLGALLAETGRIREAVGFWEQALEINPDYIEARHNLAMALVELGRLDEAIRMWERILERRPADARARTGIEQARASMRE